VKREARTGTAFHQKQQEWQMIGRGADGDGDGDGDENGNETGVAKRGVW